MVKDDPKKNKIGSVKSHFLDSGAFTLWTTALKYHQENNCGRWDYYNTDEFWEYVDAYAAFLKKYKIAIDLYANIDAIGNPEITYRNQKYLEDEHGLSPVPVVHYETPLSELEKYIDEGYELIGLGGLVGSTMKKKCQNWIDSCFDLVCDNPKRLPKVKLHGFGVTSYRFLVRYPWWSVDSAAWDKIASYGGICVPKKTEGKFAFIKSPYIMKVSTESPHKKIQGGHVGNVSPEKKKLIQEWLDFIKIPMGRENEKGEVIEKGVVTYHVYRRIANLYFYDMMVKSLPKYPWPFRPKRRTLI